MTTREAVLRAPSIGKFTARITRRYPKAALGASVLLLILFLGAVGADVLRPSDTRSADLSATLQPPSLSNPMGTDQLGRDLFMRVLHGLRVSFLISISAALGAIAVGGVIGVAAGTMGGKVDSLMMRGIDVFQSQNHLLFGILIVVLFRPVLGAPAAIMLSVALTHWVKVARIVRGELLSIAQRPFIAAAVNGGAGRWRLARRHYIPHLVPAMGLGFVLLMPHAIFHETGLSFLGLGMQAHQASLGNVLSDSRQAMLSGAWWAALFPGAVIFLAAMAVGTVGEYLRDRHNPRWRSEMEL